MATTTSAASVNSRLAQGSNDLPNCLALAPGNFLGAVILELDKGVPSKQWCTAKRLGLEGYGCL
jgi:hypothetical protein